MLNSLNLLNCVALLPTVPALATMKPCTWPFSQDVLTTSYIVGLTVLFRHQPLKASHTTLEAGLGLIDGSRLPPPFLEDARPPRSCPISALQILPCNEEVSAGALIALIDEQRSRRRFLSAFWLVLVLKC